MNTTAAKLSFLNSVIGQGLDKIAQTPNIASPRGEMSHDKKLAFLAAVTKHGLKHFDVGGTVNNSGLLGSIGSGLGLNDQFQAQGSNVTSGTNAGELGNAASGANIGISQQRALANTLTPQAQQAATAQTGLSYALANESLGQGPNPAQAAYNQNIQNIAKQQAGAIGSTKGISPALQAQLISQEGSSAMQNAAGQSATTAAQQQIAAQNSLQNLSANQIAQSQGAVQGLNNAQQNEQNILQGANTAFNNTLVAQTSNQNNVNSNTALANQQQANNILGGIGSALSSIPIVGSLFAKGGDVKKIAGYADGGVIAPSTSAPQSYAGQWLNSSVNTSGPQTEATRPANIAQVDLSKAFGEKGNKSLNPSVPDNSDLETSGYAGADIGGFGSTGATGAADLGGGDIATMLAASGGPVKAKNTKQKAVVKGDSLKNDKIPAMLSAGEFVIDKDTMQDKGPVGQMARTLAEHIRKRNK